MLKSDVINLYRLLRKYKKSKGIAKKIVTEHFFYKVSGIMDDKEYIEKIDRLINEYENEKKRG